MDERQKKIPRPMGRLDTFWGGASRHEWINFGPIVGPIGWTGDLPSGVI